MKSIFYNERKVVKVRTEKGVCTGKLLPMVFVQTKDGEREYTYQVAIDGGGVIKDVNESKLAAMCKEVYASAIDSLSRDF